MEDDLTRGRALAAYLARTAAEPFAWGSCDCCLWACGWVLERRGVDPLAQLRGTYADEAGAAAILAREGGLPALLGRVFAAAGLAPGLPEPGAVGVVGTLLGPATMLAVRPGVWAGKSPRGLRTVRARASLTWSV